MKPFVAAVTLATILSAGATAWAEDAENCKDHPLFSRMPNYEIHECATTQFDAVGFPRPELKEWNTPEEYTTVEGKIHAISYRPKEGATPTSALQIVRNFQNAVKKDNGTVLGDYGPDLYPHLPDTAVKYIGGTFDRYTTMTLNKGGSEFWIYLGASDGDEYKLLMVEKQEMKQEISVNDLAQQLDKDGFLTYHINFDTGKAIIKPDSEGSISQIATLMHSVPTLKVSIEGHTDNVGTPESNMKLSEERAKAVMAAVVAKGIAADRMTAVGRGQDAPVADNRKEEGRALNRRVEVVKK